jgi:hypothetical protein|tara:strand:+ start:110 stop:559 length:450 start_codon:yes stop_codon:yes gene_type:complete
MRKFRSPNAGQTALTLQHSTSPRSGYRPPAGHNADGYTMPERVGFKRGGGVTGAKKEEMLSFREKKRKQFQKNQVDFWRRKKEGEENRRERIKRVSHRDGGSANWIQDVNKSIKKRGTKGKCTPITKKGCTGRAKALAKTFKKMAKKRG